jgi:hypothetical protein
MVTYSGVDLQAQRLGLSARFPYAGRADFFTLSTRDDEREIPFDTLWLAEGFAGVRLSPNRGRARDEIFPGLRPPDTSPLAGYAAVRDHDRRGDGEPSPPTRSSAR